MTSTLRLEMQQLLSSLCDGELSDAEHDRLEELMSADVECRRVYLEYMDLHSQLLVKAQHDDMFPAAAQTVPSSLAGSAQRPGRGTVAYRYLLVAVATLTATLLVQVYWWRPANTETTLPKRTIATPAVVEESNQVATLRDAVGGEWGAGVTPLQVGARLMPGELRLPKGIFNIQFDSGAELVIEGPAALRVESSTAVTVLSGKVVLRADESAAPFDLSTPMSSFAEIGTELAVNVSTEGEEIHVFQGEVQRKSRSGAIGAHSEQLKAGEAWRYEPKVNASGRPMKCEPGRFVRQAPPPPGRPMDPGLGQLAYEGFDYRNPMVMTSSKQPPVKGWIGPWKAGFTRPHGETDRPRFPLNSRESLSRAGAAVPSVGGSFEYAGFAQYWRRLARPVRLEIDRSHYLSFLFHRHGAPSDPANSVGIQLWTHEDYQSQKFEDARQRLYIGVKKANQLTARFQGMESQAPLALNIGSTYLLVAKISATQAGPNRVYLRVYGPEENVDSTEPTNWSLTTAPFPGDQVFDWLQLHINSKTRQTIDEIRLGTSWPAVTSAYVKKNQV